MKMPTVFISAIDKRTEPTLPFREGVVASVSGSYSSDRPLVDFGDSEVQIINYSAHTLTVGAKVWVAVQGGNQVVLGKHPDT